MSSIVFWLCFSMAMVVGDAPVGSAFPVMPALPASDVLAGEELLQRFFDAWAQVRSVSYRLHKVERMRDGEVVREAVDVKLRKPLAVYAAAILPRRGQELIYDQQVNADELVVHPGHFPDITLRLDIHGGLATKRQHHTIEHSGFDYLIWALRRAPAKVSFTGESTLFGRPVQRLLVEANQVGTRWLHARDGETLFMFAQRVGMDAYYIYYHNPRMDGLNHILDDEPYSVPLAYGTKTEIILDARFHIPVQISVWDEEGRLYEQLQWTRVTLNPRLTDATFDPENPAYNF